MSNLVPYRIQLDVKEVASQLSFSIAKGDTGRRLIIQLIDDGKAFDLARGNYAIFTADKPDGTTIFNDCTIKDNLIIYDITKHTVSALGITECEIVLYDSTGYVITSPKFSMIVYDAIRNRVDLPSEDEMDVLDAIAFRESERIAKEEAREDNEFKRNDNESIRMLNEADRLATVNVISNYITGNEPSQIDSFESILGLIDARMVGLNKHNFFEITMPTEGGATSVAIISYGLGKLPNDMDVEEPLVPNVVYYYEGYRFVGLDKPIPELSLLKAHEENVEALIDEAENTVAVITNPNNYNKANGFVRLDANAKIPADLIPFERTIEMFPINSEEDLTSLYQANVGDIAFMSESTEDNKIITKSWRLFGDYYIKDNWLLQSTTFNSTSLYAEESGHSQNTTKVNGVLVRFGSVEEYNSTDKDGLYVITNYAEEV